MVRALLMLGLLSGVAFAHDDPHWTTADRQWFKSQKSPKTGQLCCNENDGAEAEEDIRNGQYWTRWPQNPFWVMVPDEVVIKDPNRNGAPVVWWWYENGVTKIQCYAPGGGV